MTFELRQALREAVDQSVRSQINWEAEPRCRGCGVAMADRWTGTPIYVDGCRCCSERRATRAKRERAEEAA